MGNIWDEILSSETKYKNYSEVDSNEVACLRLAEFKKRDLAVQIYSEILGCELWLCSNEKMANQIKNDDPNAIIYTVDEIMNLIKLKPNPEELRRIHDVKEVFVNSKTVDCSLDGENHDK